MKKRFISILLICICIILPIHSIGFEYHILEIKTSPEFTSGIMPFSLLYQFNFPIPELLKNNTTLISARFDNGVSFRTLSQDPITGTPFASNPENTDWQYPKDYISIYDEMNIVLCQGFLQNPIGKKDLIRLWTTFDVRFEDAYERFNFLKNDENMEGLFIKKPATKEEAAIERFPGIEWIGQPELKGNRSSLNFTISLGLDINVMEDKITRRNGLKFSSWTRLNPKWFDFTQSNTQDFILLWNQLDLAFTPYFVKMQGERDTTWFSIVLDNSTTYRFITGQKSPYYLQSTDIMGIKPLNTQHTLSNRTSLTLYGPQINSYDCYPFISAFIDVGYSCGPMLNNNSGETYSDVLWGFGFKTEFIVYNIANFYYEIDFIKDNVLNEKPCTVNRIGFSLGI